MLVEERSPFGKPDQQVSRLGHGKSGKLVQSAQDRIDRRHDMGFGPPEGREAERSQSVLKGANVMATKGEIVEKVHAALAKSLVQPGKDRRAAFLHFKHAQLDSLEFFDNLLKVRLVVSRAFPFSVFACFCHAIFLY
jgi:hypothetical protein